MSRESITLAMRDATEKKSFVPQDAHAEIQLVKLETGLVKSLAFNC